MSIELTAKQQEAVTVATTELRVIITGGAGSGKTTVIRTVADKILENEDRKLVICAPTGKAAARIREATGYKAFTVHAACGFFPVDGDDELGTSERPPLVADATDVIVDEASMLDDQVLAGLCSRLRPQTRLILVGDPNQLAPVGAGYPFRDLIVSGVVPHVHLDVCHRQDGQLLNNCYAVLDGDSSNLIYDAGKEGRATADWSFIECSDDGILAGLSKLFSKGECEPALGIAPEELLVLTPINKGPWGRTALNRLIQNVYHTSRGRTAPTYKDEKGFDQFVPGDRVVWRKNDKQLGLVNGDTGTVTAVGQKDIVVDFDGIGVKKVDAGKNLQLAWVLTCHLAQGSQYRKVLVVQAGKHCNGYLSSIINRSWVYTAGTRSKESTYWLGSASSFKDHVKTKSVDRRQTYLSDLLAKV
jgi:exodeoxyribonuclease V alpha subunit